MGFNSGLKGLTSALYRIGGEGHDPTSLPRENDLGTYCTGSWVGARAGVLYKVRTESSRSLQCILILEFKVSI